MQACSPRGDSQMPSVRGHENRENRIPSLDGMRAISIALVLGGHVAGTRGAYGEEIFQYVGDFAQFGVRVFFVISGFLITSLLMKERASAGRISLGGFYKRRMLRILPAFYAFLLAVCLLQYSGALKVSTPDLLAALTFTTNFRAETWNLGHIWSLSVEEQFYFLWPAAMACLGRTRAIEIGLGTLVIAPMLRGFWAWKEAPDDGQFFLNADILAGGCLLALLRSRLHANTRYMRMLSSTWIATAPVGALTINALHGFGIHSLFSGVMTILIAITIDRVITYPEGIAAFLNWGPVVFVGTLSYSLYLWQQIFLNRFGPLIINAFPLNIILAIACALLSYYLVERPFLRLRNSRRAARSDQMIHRESEPAAIVTGYEHKKGYL
jgi:peptidoglycan/LPS O-acetylase OafA/YrhL